MKETEIQKQLKEIKDLLIFNKKVLNLKEVAKYIGYSESHLYKLTSTNRIPHSKPNRSHSKYRSMTSISSFLSFLNIKYHKIKNKDFILIK